MSGSLPTFKLEGMPDDHVKVEHTEDTPSPYGMDDEDRYMDDVEVDDPELDFKQARQDVWLSRIPKSMWETFAQLDNSSSLANVNDDEDVEIGTVRIEGSLSKPQRVSLMLKKSIPAFNSVPKEYRLNATVPSMRRSKRPGQVLVFSEKDKPGYKAKSFAWDELDEDGNPGQGRSYLYENQKRQMKKKENKGRYVPYTKRPIPKLTTLAGTVSAEYETVPVENDEWRRLEEEAVSLRLKRPEKREAELALVDPTRQHATVMSAREKAEFSKSIQAKKQAAKDNRVARMEKSDLIDALLDAFKQHCYWGLRDLRHRVQQPEQYLRETLEEIAFMWTRGDFNGKWELKAEFKNKDSDLLNSTGAAPKAEDSEVDMKSPGDDDEDEAFEDV